MVQFLARVSRGSSSTDVPSGSTRNTGFEPGGGAGGSSRTKQTTRGSRKCGSVPGNGAKVTPAPLRAVRAVESPMRGRLLFSLFRARYFRDTIAPIDQYWTKT